MIERRTRGDLIEFFKIWAGIVDYGKDMLSNSRSGYNMNLRTSKGEKLHSAFPSRIANYWNKIPDYVKDADSVDSFKARLGAYKAIKVNEAGHYWELSELILTKIESVQPNRDDYVSFMIENPSVARRRHLIIRDI